MITAKTTEFQYQFIRAKKVGIKSPKLMIVLHGRGDSLRPFRKFNDEIRMPEMNYLLLNAPRKYDGGFTWYAFPPKQAKGVLGARKKLESLMSELENQGWDLKNIFLLGFSQGSLVSCDFIMNYKKVIGGIIGISGYIYFFENWKKKLPKSSFETPWIITHGLEDEDLLIEETRVDVKKMIKAKLPIDWVELHKEHEIDCKVELPLIRRWLRKQY